MSASELDLSPTVALARELIQRPSITPDDSGCQQLIADRLAAVGFDRHEMDRNGVTNSWIRRGLEAPLLVLAGHTDVVPTGPESEWRHPPFDGVMEGGMLHGRGAADMKGSIAAFVCACESFVSRHPDHSGSIALLITSDEEGPATDGTRAVLDELARTEKRIDYCVVGEPSSSKRLGDVVKVGRRGSLGATLVIHGRQGHIAYPHLASNPIHLALPALEALTTLQWDQGNADFEPTSLQISNIQAGTGAHNVIPGSMIVEMNFRFSPEVTDLTLRQQTEALLQQHGLDFSLDWRLSGQPFQTAPGELRNAVTSSVLEVTGDSPQCSTGGGTSDGRFIAPTGAEVVELGPVNATIHQVDECVSMADLDLLTRCYQGVLERMLR
jgi:succinyl-diaminopimelate desuccinylase